MQTPSEPELRPEYFRRYDERADAEFYTEPRLVQHIDDGAIAAVTELYREAVPEGSAVLDLMSSWVSHLPPDVRYARVAGLGMNEHELARNPQLTEYVVHDLNADPRLPYGNAEFDAAIVTVSVQYLTRPVEVFREVARVLKPSAPLVLTFSNRCFPEKAIAAWHALDDTGHVELVGMYFRLSGCFEQARALRLVEGKRGIEDPLFAVYAFRLPVLPSHDVEVSGG